MSIPVCRAEDGEIMTLGGATIELIDRVPESYSMNNRSAQQYLTFGERTMLFTADLERYGMMAMLEEMNPEDLRADILKYPHHGKSGLVPEYYDAVQPLLSVMTNYERGLEGQESMSMRKRPYVCSMYGGLRLTCDGTRWFVERPVKSEADAEPKEEAP